MKMKITEAWGWLAAGVLAAGLNASYHNGGLQWAHRVADRFDQDSQAVLAQASGHANQFLSEARLLTGQEQTASCPLAMTMTRVQTKIDRSQAVVDRFEGMSTRQEARLEASRARMEARIAARTAHLRIAKADFAPAALEVMPAPVVCPRIRVNVPRVPRIKVPVVPTIHIYTGSAGPV
jgi:hypothetical protein